MLSTLITSRARVELITWFVTHPGERFYYQQLAGILSASRKSIQNELKRLEKAGFLVSQKEGNIRFYQVNREFILYPEIKSIIFKTVGVGDELKKALARIGDIRSAFIYGSVAKNLEDATSDIDVMVIGDVSTEALHDALYKAEKALGRELNYTVFSAANWKRDIKAGKAFVRDVSEGEKIYLIGTGDDLRKIS